MARRYLPVLMGKYIQGTERGFPMLSVRLTPAPPPPLSVFPLPRLAQGSARLIKRPFCILRVNKALDSGAGLGNGFIRAGGQAASTVQ